MTLKTNQTLTTSTKKQSTSQQLNQLNAQTVSHQKLSDVSYRHLTKLVDYVENADTPENAQRGRANFQAAYKNLSSSQKQQLMQRYEKETGQPPAGDDHEHDADWQTAEDSTPAPATPESAPGRSTAESEPVTRPVWRARNPSHRPFSATEEG